MFLGSDTQASPNDPSAGNNDWVVELGAIDFGETTTGWRDPYGHWASRYQWLGGRRVVGPECGTVSSSGRVPMRTATAPLAPSGVAGRFWAETVTILLQRMTTDPENDDACG